MGGVTPSPIFSAYNKNLFKVEKIRELVIMTRLMVLTEEETWESIV